MNLELDGLRILLAFVCGHALCLSGSLTQIVTANPLASPSTLGLDGLVVLFVLLAHIAISLTGTASLEWTSFALFAISLLPLISWIKTGNNRQGSLSMAQIILLGLGFNLLVGAVFSVVQFLFMAINLQFPSGLWFGNFRAADWQYLWLLIPLFIFSIVCSLKLAKSLSILNIDATLAKSLGVRVENTQKQALGLSLILTAGVICFFGVFSFLGLIFPHLMRSFPGIKGNVRMELLVAPVIAGGILSLLDQLCYNLDIYGAELPVGMVSSVLGSLLLLIIVLKKSLNF